MDTFPAVCSARVGEYVAVVRDVALDHIPAPPLHNTDAYSLADEPAVTFTLLKPAQV